MNTRKLLVLDLDETLIHATEVPLDRAADFRVAGYHVYLRPHLEDFLQYALAAFEVGVWTSAGGTYAEGVVSRLFADGALRFLWSSRRCTTRRNPVTGEYFQLKRLSKLKRLGYALETVIAVDDTPEKHGENYGNLVHIAEFTGDPLDAELPMLRDYLQTLAGEGNVRTIEKRGWRAAMLRARGSAA